MSKFVYATSRLLVEHFKNIHSLDSGGLGFHSRLFSHALHPEEKFILEGQSQGVIAGEPSRLEHLVPCMVLFTETTRLLKEGRLTSDEIAQLLQKHWRVARITKKEQETLDNERGLKSSMPPGWNYETGSTLARLEAAKIVLNTCAWDRFPCQ